MKIALQVLAASWTLLGEMAPYLLFGFLVAGLLSVFVSPEWIEEHLGRKGFAQVAKASLFGVPIPLCSCGVLPVAASLRRHGAGKGATTAFLLSTPQTGVDSIAVTWALLGPVVAIIRPVAAFLTGIAGGMVVQAVEPADEKSVAPAQDQEAGDRDELCCPSDQNQKSAIIRALRYGFVTLPQDIGRALVVGLILSGVIAAFLGPQHVKMVFGGGLLPYVVAMAVGIPLYVCATASTPIAASLIGAGLSPGAALVFLISGPATNVASVTTLLRVLGRRVVFVYLATVVVGSLATGLMVDFFLDGRVLTGAATAAIESAHRHAEGTMTMGWGFRDVCAVVLLAILVAASWPRRSPVAEEDRMTESTEERVEFSIGGMRCNGCVTSIGRALGEVGGVTDVKVDLSSAKAVVTGMRLDPTELAAEIKALGFDCDDGLG